MIRTAVGCSALALYCTLLAAAQSVPSAAASPEGPPPMPARDPHTRGFVVATDLKDGALPPPTVDGNFVLGATHTPAPETQVNPAVPHGKITTFTMTSAESRYYPGIARDPGPVGMPDPRNPARIIVTTSHPAPWTRTVTVYVPAQYVPGTESPFIVGADGPDAQLFTVLDNLIAERKIPPMIAVSIGSGGGHAEGSERGLEYDTVSGKYAEFVEHEVLPLVEKHCPVKLTRDPDGRAAVGVASGGSASLGMAWFHPEIYHRVLSYSGTFINQQWPYNPALPHGAWEFHERLIPSAPAKPIRIWIEVGDRDLLNPNTMRDGMHDWVLANERMAAAFKARGYHYQFVFARNANTGDAPTKSQTLPEALEYLWQGYKPPR